jgi:hypothetical protein
MPVNMNAIDYFATSGRIVAHGADHTDFVTRLDQGRSFVPNAPVERHRKILDDDQDPFRLKWITS